MKNMNYAVITGDIIHSTKLSNNNIVTLINNIKEALFEWSKNYKMRVEFYRGDSFQCLLGKPNISLRVALIIKTYIRSLNPSELFNIEKHSDRGKKIPMIYTNWLLDARITIGIGAADLSGGNLANSHGDAFTLSGRLLDDMKESKRSFGIATSDNFHSEFFMESLLLDTIIAKTTALQCQVINLKLLGYTELEIAKKLKIAQSAVNQRSISGNWNAIDAMVKYFEKRYING
jgi:hypothetical protein